MPNFENHVLAPTASTGNNTHAAKDTNGVYATAICQLVVEAVGATPTVTFKFQGSYDGTNWYDLAYVTDASDTLSNSTRTATAVGVSSNISTRPYRLYRLITSLNTNVTYRGELYLV